MKRIIIVIFTIDHPNGRDFQPKALRDIIPGIIKENSVKKFSSIVESTSALQQEITQFINKVKRQLPQKVLSAIAMTQRLELTTSVELDELKNSRKTDLKKLAIKWGNDVEDLSMLRDLLNELRGDIKLMPQYMPKTEREALEKGRMSAGDITMDFDSRVGRNVIAKMYMPLAMSVANDFVKRSGSFKLTKQDFLGACLEALSEAISSYRDEIKAKGFEMTFGAYAKKKMTWACMEFMNKQGSDFSGTYSKVFTDARDNGSSADLFAKSIDSFRDGDDDAKQDHIAALGVSDDHRPKYDDSLELLYSGIEKKFNQRDADIFYRYFGINGRDREKGTEISKHYGISAGVVTQTVTKIIKYIKTDKRMEDTLEILRDMFTESLLYDLRHCGARIITETLEQDEIYILFEELFRFKDRKAFVKAYEMAIKVSDVSDILDDFNSMDSSLKIRRREISAFLSALYPTENISMKTDVDLLEMLQEVSMYLKKYNIIESAEENGESIKSLDDFKELARAKFKEVFGDKLDKERMEFTIKGFIKTNKKDVDEENWGELVGKFNQSFAVKESVETGDPVCRLYNIFWGTPTDSLMYMENGIRYINNARNFEQFLYKTTIGGYNISQSGFINLAAMLEHYKLGWAHLADKIVIDTKENIRIATNHTALYINGERRELSTLGVLPIDGQTLGDYGDSLRKAGLPVQQVGEMLWTRVRNTEIVIEARERVDLPELEAMLLAKIGPLYVVKGRKGYRLSSDDAKWNRVLKSPFNYLPTDFEIASSEDQFEMVFDILKSIS